MYGYDLIWNGNSNSCPLIVSMADLHEQQPTDLPHPANTMKVKMRLS